jgi:hypothetical protein
MLNLASLRHACRQQRAMKDQGTDTRHDAIPSQRLHHRCEWTCAGLGRGIICGEGISRPPVAVCLLLVGGDVCNA